MEKKNITAALISFTARGAGLGKRLARALSAGGYLCTCYEKRRLREPGPAPEEQAPEENQAACGDKSWPKENREACRDKSRPEENRGEWEPVPVDEPVGRWAGRRFWDSEAIIFIGAMGIAIRSIAPWVRDKWTDPAVVVMDEAGNFVIPVLSGHAGGANELAAEIGRILGAVPVITTATDVNRLFAVDVFAVKNGLTITDRALAREISGEILEGNRVGVFSDYSIEGTWPPELAWGREQRRNFWITRKREGAKTCTLKLVPRVIHIGIGCRKGASAEQIGQAVFQVLEQMDCLPESVAAVATIDLKKDEEGLLQLSRQLQVPFLACESRDLADVEGEFEESPFVARVAGVGNVCERAALKSVSLTRGGGELICRKQIVNGVTVALAEESWKGIL